MIQIAQQTNPYQRQQQMLQFQIEMQRKSATDIYKSKPVDVRAVENVKVRSLAPPIEYDDQGQLLTGSLIDYPIPRADDIPEVVTEHLHFTTDHNRLGIRGVGEGPTGPPPAAIANAVSDAFGGRLSIRFPVLTAARVHAALIEAGVAPERERTQSKGRQP